jgi:hypothetical protein
VTIEITAETLVIGDILNQVSVTANSGTATGSAESLIASISPIAVPVDDPLVLTLLALALTATGLYVMRRR